VSGKKKGKGPVKVTPWGRLLNYLNLEKPRLLAGNLKGPQEGKRVWWSFEEETIPMKQMTDLGTDFVGS